MIILLGLQSMSVWERRMEGKKDTPPLKGSSTPSQHQHRGPQLTFKIQTTPSPVSFSDYTKELSSFLVRKVGLGGGGEMPGASQEE